jgi:hypothetical protein
MLFNVALFSSLLLVLAVLAVPSASGASVGRLRERRQSHSQPGSRIVDVVSNTEYTEIWAGAILSGANVCNTFHGLFYDRHRSHPHSFYVIGNIRLGHRNIHRPRLIGFARGFCLRLGWYRWYPL